MKILKLLSLILITTTAFAQQRGTFTDRRDGKIYSTIQIGTQVWMSENLNYDVGEDCRCYDNSTENCKVYGRLYDWYGAMKSVPQGWRLPSEQDWKTLEKYIGMNDSDLVHGYYRGESVNAGGKLKSKSLWHNPNIGANDSVGFNALPGGCSSKKDTTFHFLNECAMFWTATSGNNDSFAFYRDFHYTDNMIFKGCRWKLLMFSARCVKN